MDAAGSSRSGSKLFRWAKGPVGTSSSAGSKAATGSKGPTGSKGATGSKGPKQGHHRLTGWIPIGRGAKLAKRAKSKGSSGGGSGTNKKEPVSAQTRRSRIPVALAAAFALVVLVTNFPLTTLLSQHHELSAASAQLQQTQKANRLLADQDRQLNSTAAIDRLARQDYQMLGPGQTLYDVLPASSSTTSTTSTASTGSTGSTTSTAPGGPISGDPGDQPLVEPSKAPDMSPDPGLAQSTLSAGSPSAPSSAQSGATDTGGGKISNGSDSAAGSAAASGRSGFWSRVAGTLEFWK
jgi:cell division protein FtsB